MKLLHPSLLAAALLAPATYGGSPAPTNDDLATVAALLHKHTAVLASDEFGGRAPATPGEQLTINYLREQFKALGIAPGNGDSYFQEVQVTEIVTDSDALLQVPRAWPRMGRAAGRGLYREPLSRDIR
ncbi:MAG: hypothetical protein ACR2PJ_07345 [Pseudomonadales bacterium]